MLDDDYTLATRLASLRWPDGPTCTRCGHDRFCHLRSRPRVFECLGCRRQLSVTAGTLLHGTRLPLRVWFLAASLELDPQGVSTAQLAREAGLSNDTAWHVKQRLQAAMRSPTAELLETFVETSRGATRSARCPRDPRKHRLPFAAFRADDNAVYLCPLPAAGPVRNTCDELSKKWGDRDRTRAAIRSVNHRIHTVHHGVSELWFSRYLDAWATAARWRSTSSEPVELALTALMTSPRTTFPCLRPERPAWWLNARWRQSARSPSPRARRGTWTGASTPAPDP